jgi:dihydrofolate reductase
VIVSIIAAMAEADRAIGLRGALPWRLPADMERFRELTMGHAVIMGRATWEPMAERGLPGRRVIVLSRTARTWETCDAVAASLPDALQIAAQNPQETETFVAGGAEIYMEALEQTLVDRMYLTIVHAEVEADAFFPKYDEANWITASNEVFLADDRNPHRMTFRLLERSRE